MEKGVVSTIKLKMIHKEETTLEVVMIIKIKIVEATGVAITTKTTIKIIVL